MKAHYTMILAVSLAACASQSNTPAEKAAGLTDADVAAIVVAANAIDAEAGDVAVAKGASDAVRNFGKAMAETHRAVNTQAGELVQKLGITPTENSISEQLRADAATVARELANKSGEEFDRAYLAREVAFHKAVLSAIDEVLLPNTKSPELKEAITGVRPAIVGHLQHAEHLAKTIN
jgi:putative membrane protein